MEAFGEVIATGVTVVAIIAAFVGAEVITVGQATWLLLGLAGAGGVKAFHDRYQEVEHLKYEVSVPNILLYSAGDIVGVSQLIEGISGQRLGTNVSLGSSSRSRQLGAGIGAIATLLMGSRAYRSGEQLGCRFRVPQAGLTPAGPNAAAQVKLPTAKVPPKPVPSEDPGPKEKAWRASFAGDLRTGFDRFIAEMRAREDKPEVVLAKLTDAEVRSAARKLANKQAAEEARGAEAERKRSRARDDPLRPILRNTEKRGNIEIHYENEPPKESDIDHAQEIAAESGEPVHLFGDTASGVHYPGIDGTIGSPPRPLSLKSHSVDANVGSARFAAQEALKAAKVNGYTEVEVSIRMPGKTVAEIRAGWDLGPTRAGDHPLEPVYEGRVVAKITVRCKNNRVWVVPKAGARTGVVPLPSVGGGQRQEDADR